MFRDFPPCCTKLTCGTISTSVPGATFLPLALWSSRHHAKLAEVVLHTQPPTFATQIQQRQPEFHIGARLARRVLAES